MRPGRAADHSPPSIAAVMEQYSYTSNHPLGHIGPVTGKFYLYIYICMPTLLPDDVLIEKKHAVEICTNQAEELIFVRRRQK